MAFHPLTARPLAMFTLNRIPFHAGTKSHPVECEHYPTCIVTLRLRDHCAAASLCYRNRAKITVPIGEQKP